MNRRIHHTIVVGLGFGDEGKGTVVDALARRQRAGAVVRFNGGPQAAHHVVTPGQQLHCFSQWGSGSFVEGTETHLSRHMMIEPFALCREAEALVSKGVDASLSRMLIDGSCVVITPFHKWLNRIQEQARGDGRHGSCGLGVGQAFMDTLQPGFPVIRAYDLHFRERLQQKLHFLSMLKRDLAEQILDEHPEDEAIRGWVEMMARSGLVLSLVDRYLSFARESGVRIVSSPDFSKMWRESAAPVIWEGAQGVLLDAEQGFWPHVTPSTTTPANAEELLEECDAPIEIERIGVLRAYSSRHGAGPFVAEDTELSQRIPDLHNGHNQWQGGFRVGWFDLVMARYALDVSETIDSLAITQLDRLAGHGPIKVCEAYRFIGPTEGELERFFVLDESSEEPLITGIRVPDEPNRAYQTELTHMLQWCRPVCRTLEGWDQSHLDALSKGEWAGPLTVFLSELEAELETPISVLSMGPSADEKVFWSGVNGKRGQDVGAVCAQVPFRMPQGTPWQPVLHAYEA
jgi:adenylosuccinate synthase